MLFMGCGIFRVPFFEYKDGSRSAVTEALVRHTAAAWSCRKPLRMGIISAICGIIEINKSPKPAEGDGCAAEISFLTNNSEDDHEKEGSVCCSSTDCFAFYLAGKGR